MRHSIMEFSLAIQFLLYLIAINFSTCNPEVLNDICGKLAKSSDRVFNQTEQDISFPGDWPWLATINRKTIDESENLYFLCTGSLISRKHVLTASNCFIQSNTLLSTKEILVELGKHYLHDPDNLFNHVTRGVSRIFTKIPKNKYRLANHFSHYDLAIVLLRTPVEFGTIIQPICLDDGSRNIEEMIGEAGYIIGWNVHGQNHMNEPRAVTTRIVSQDACYDYYNEYARIMNRTFCTEGQSFGKTPCHLGKGSGFIMQNSKTGRFHIRGVILKVFESPTMTKCERKQLIFIGDILERKEWILRKLSRDIHRYYV